jgi:acyl-CoA thioester hydrolase
MPAAGRREFEAAAIGTVKHHSARDNRFMPDAAAPSLDDYAHRRTIPTRWKDNDVYGHVNNVEYYSFFDTVINAWLIEEGGLDIHAGRTIGVCAESRCRFLASVAFPDPVEAGLRVGHLGNSSVRYEIGLFDGEGRPLAEGDFVHVFVDRQTRRPEPIPEGMRACLERIRV